MYQQSLNSMKSFAFTFCEQITGLCLVLALLFLDVYVLLTLNPSCIDYPLIQLVKLSKSARCTIEHIPRASHRSCGAVNPKLKLGWLSFGWMVTCD